MFFKVFFISLTLIIPLTQAKETPQTGTSTQAPAVPDVVSYTIGDPDLKFHSEIQNCSHTETVCDCEYALEDTKTKCDPALAKGKIQCVKKTDRLSTIGDSTTTAKKSIVDIKDTHNCIKGTVTSLTGICEETAKNCEEQCEQAIKDTENKIEYHEEEVRKNKINLKEEEDKSEEEKDQPKINNTIIPNIKGHQDKIEILKVEKGNSENNEQACGKYYTSFAESMGSFLGSVASKLTPSLDGALRIAELVSRLTGGKGEKTPGPGGGDPQAECIKRGWTWNADSIIKCKKPTDPLDGGNGGKPTGGDPFGPLQPSGDPKGNPKGDPNGPNGPSPLNPILPPGGSGSTTSGGEGSGGSNNGSGGGGGIVAGGIASGGMGGGGFNHNEGEDSEDPTSAYKPHKQEYSSGGGGGSRGYASLNQGRRQMLAKLGIKVKPKKTKETSKRTSLIETSQHENIFARITSRFNELCKNKIDCY